MPGSRTRGGVYPLRCLFVGGTLANCGGVSAVVAGHGASVRWLCLWPALCRHLQHRVRQCDPRQRRPSLTRPRTTNRRVGTSRLPTTSRSLVVEPSAWSSRARFVPVGQHVALYLHVQSRDSEDGRCVTAVGESLMHAMIIDTWSFAVVLFVRSIPNEEDSDRELGTPPAGQ